MLALTTISLCRNVQAERRSNVSVQLVQCVYVTTHENCQSREHDTACSKKVQKASCLFSASVTMTSQLKQPFYKGSTLQKIHCEYAQLTARVLAPPTSGQPSPATHSSYITSSTSICVIENEAEFGLWIADSMCSTVSGRFFK